MAMSYSQILLFYLVTGVRGVELPGTCNSTQYYEPSVMECLACPANVSMVASSDGYSCTCEEHSIPAGISRCRACNVTEVVTADGRACVPRRCQSSAGWIVCRKCPADYISVTQNLDGTPTKEVQCIKCARGYKPSNNVCVRCESCACAKHEIVLRGRCVPKRYVTDRPKYDESKMHPNELLDVVKHEYFCMQNDVLACRTLADECVRSFYSTDLAGPCRLWIQPKVQPPKGLPKLVLETTASEDDPDVIGLTRGMKSLHLVSALYTSMGGLKILFDTDANAPCVLPVEITIGKDYSVDCNMNISQLESSLNETLSPYLYVDGELKALPISLRKTNGEYVQRGTWPSSKFRRYFLVQNSLSITANMTNTVYLRTLLIRLRIERNKLKSSSLRLYISMEAQYETKSSLSNTITTTLRVEHELPNAGVLRGLEIWGGVLGAFLALYAVVQWRGNLRRGGLHFSLVPLLSAAAADTLYFAALFSTLHAVAAEAGSLGMTLSLSHSEEHMIKVFIYSAVALKAVNVAWINYSQCKCDIFFLDWSEYNPPLKDLPVFDKSDNWKTSTLAREWSRMQTIRRASPAYTIVLALIVLQLMQSLQAYVPQSHSYRWAIATLAWWCAYVTAIAIRWILDRVLEPTTAMLLKVCKSLGLSLLVFQEEYYAHYVHGRIDDSDVRSLLGPLAACRVVCAPQLRCPVNSTANKKLMDIINCSLCVLTSDLASGLGEKISKKALLSKFLAAFFERALDGLSWVASERTIPERLLDIELVPREAGNTSALLYDPDNNSAPSCFAVTWWSEEWTLGTFDASLFGCVFLTTTDSLLSSLLVLITWQILKFLRTWFGNKNQIEKTEIEISVYYN